MRIISEEFENKMLKRLDSICMWYRHDFGLLTEDEKEKHRFEAKQYIHAISKEVEGFL